MAKCPNDQAKRSSPFLLTIALVFISGIKVDAEQSGASLSGTVSLQNKLENDKTKSADLTKSKNIDIQTLCLESIAAKEPVPLANFPPIPLRLELPGSSGKVHSSRARNKGWDLNAGPEVVLLNAKKYLDAERCIRDGKFDDAIEIAERAYFAKPDRRFEKLISLAYKKQGHEDLAKLWAHGLLNANKAKVLSPGASLEKTAASGSHRESVSHSAINDLIVLKKHENEKGASGLDSIDAHLEHARALRQEGNLAPAFLELRKTVLLDCPKEKSKELSLCHSVLGDILLEQAYIARDEGRGNIGMQILQNACMEFRRASYLDANDSEGVQGLLECALQAVSINPSFDNRLTLGAAYLLSKDFERARIEYAECYKISPSRSELDLARKSLHLAVACSPKSTDADLAETVKKVKQIIDDYGEDDPKWWYILGRLRERQGELEKARLCYNNAWAVNKFVDPDLKLAYARMGLKDPDHKEPPKEAESPKSVSDLKDNYDSYP